MSGTPPPAAPPHTPLPQPPVVSQPVSQPVTLPTPVFRPNKPIMGNHIQIDSNKFISFTGGKPNPAWTDTEEGSATATPSTPSQRRDHYSPEKGYYHHQKGLSKKFDRTDDLIVFENAVWGKLTNCGLDTIAYVADPVEANRMTNVVKEHTRFTLESIKIKIAPQLLKYDSYDKENDRTATMMLLSSLEAEFQDTIQQLIDDSTPFPVVWMEIVHATHSVSIERFDQIALQIKKQHPSMFAGENMEQMCKVYHKLAQELTTAGQYDHNLTLRMVKTALLAGGKDNEDYRYDLRALKKKLTVSTELLTIGYMGNEDKEKHMVKKKLTFLDICQEITNCYRLAKDNANWPPASNAPDSKAPPAGFGNVTQGTVQLVGPNGNKYAMVLQPSVGGSTFGGRSGRGPKPTDTCNNCGQTGHWARECPQKKNSSGGQGGSRGTSSNSGQNKSWKSTFSGEKQTRHGRVFEWCKQCGRYTTTHNTATHTKKSTNPAPTSNYMMVEDPSAWLGSVDPFSLPKATTSVFSPIFWYFKFLAIPFLVGCSVGGFLDKILLAIFDAFENASPVAWIAPFLWFLALISVWLLPAWLPRPPPRPSPRWHHHRSKPRRRQQRFRPSIRTFGLHRRYPLRLRSNSHFVRSTAPTNHQHYLQERVVALQHTVLHLTDDIRRLRRSAPPPTHHPQPQPNTGRKRGWSSGPVRPHPKNKRSAFGNARGKGRSKLSYHPVPAHGFHHLGNLNPTKRQKLALAHFGMCVELQRVSFGLVSASLPVTKLLQAALLSPASFRAVSLTNSFPVIWDSGASHCIFFSRHNFCGPIRLVHKQAQLKGIAKGLPIDGIGTVCWAFSTTCGNVRVLKLPAYFVSKAKVRLMSEHSLLQTYQGETILAQANKRGLSGMGGDPSRGRIEAQVDAGTNLPVSTAYLKKDWNKEFKR